MAANNPNFQLTTFNSGTTVAFSQPLYISGDGFFLYSSALSSTWEQFDFSPSVKLNAVDYNNDGVALFAGDNGVIVKHVPGTQNPEVVVLNPNINFNDIRFYSGSKKAVAIGDSGSVYKTIDAGKNWTLVATPSYLSASLQAITFNTASHWWICGTSGTVVTSSNEGTSWYQFTNFYQLDGVISNPPISSSVNETSFDFYDIKFAPYYNNANAYTGQYSRVYVVGSSGSIFMCSPEFNDVSYTPISSFPAFYDISLAYQRSDSSHASTTYYSILYTNEWYFSGSGGPDSPNNIGVGGENGNILLIDYPDGTTYPRRVEYYDQASKDYNDPTLNVINPSSYISKSISVGSPNTINGGGIFSLVYGSSIPPQNSVFYERQLLLLTESGRLVEMDYPSQNDGEILLQTDAFNTRASESFSGALTDIDVPLFENLYDSAYVRFTLDKPLPTISSSVNPNPLWWGVATTGSNLDKLRLPTQGMRLYRRFKGENFVTLTNLLPDGKGLLIPEGYNPELNYLEIAKNAGLLPSP